MSSCHILLGRPLDLFVLFDCHSAQRLVLLSFILARCPAHFHVCFFNVYSITSMIFVLFLISELGTLPCSSPRHRCAKKVVSFQVATATGAWRCWFSARAGWSGVSILSPDDIASVSCIDFLGVAASLLGKAEPLQRYDRLVGLVVKASTSRAEDPGFESRVCRDFFEVESYQ